MSVIIGSRSKIVKRYGLDPFGYLKRKNINAKKILNRFIYSIYKKKLMLLKHQVILKSIKYNDVYNNKLEKWNRSNSIFNKYKFKSNYKNFYYNYFKLELLRMRINKYTNFLYYVRAKHRELRNDLTFSDEFLKKYYFNIKRDNNLEEISISRNIHNNKNLNKDYNLSSKRNFSSFSNKLFLKFDKEKGKFVTDKKKLERERILNNLKYQSDTFENIRKRQVEKPDHMTLAQFLIADTKRIEREEYLFRKREKEELKLNKKLNNKENNFLFKKRGLKKLIKYTQKELNKKNKEKKNRKLYDTYISYMKKNVMDQKRFFIKRGFNQDEVFQLDFNDNYIYRSKQTYTNWVVLKKKITLFYNNLSYNIIRGYCRKLRRKNYGILNYFLFLFERRIDSILIRLNIFKSKSMVRHFIRLGHVLVNGKKVTYCNYIVKDYDFITFEDEKIRLKLFNSIKYNINNNYHYISPPYYLEINYKIMTIMIISKFIKENNVYFPFKIDFNKLAMIHRSYN